MLFSKKCIYGLRATLYVASLESHQFVSIRQISENLNISFSFLTKILQELTQKNIMVSYRGPKGGVSLSKSAAQIKLIEIVNAFENEAYLSECILGLSNCGSQIPCPLHEHWLAIRNDIKSLLTNTSLYQLASQINKTGMRLTDIPAAITTPKNLS